MTIPKFVLAIFMKASWIFCGLAVATIFAGISCAQVTGDGIPDIWHVTARGTTFRTSAGMITRDVGDLVLDVDGYEGGLVALLIEGPNLVSTCSVPDGFCGSNLQLPDPTAVWGMSSWVVGYLNNKTQWIRTNPLITTGFMGVVSERPNKASNRRLKTGH